MNNTKTERLEKAKNFAESKGGTCLSTEYSTSRHKLVWKCSNPNHTEWQATFDKVVNGNRWCPECAKAGHGLRRMNKAALPNAHAKATSRGGLCLSTVYEHVHKPLKWKCSDEKHEPWLSTYANVVNRGRWCPECAKNHPSEKRVRLFFEAHFKQPFPSEKPSWNINPWSNQLLELDGYCKEFAIAFEHDGEQHFELWRNKKKKDLIYQKFKDEQKRKNCKRNGILLINIPIIDINQRDKFYPFYQHIAATCKQYGIDMQFNDSQLAELEKQFKTV